MQSIQAMAHDLTEIIPGSCTPVDAQGLVFAAALGKPEWDLQKRCLMSAKFHRFRAEMWKMQAMLGLWPGKGLVSHPLSR